MSKAKETFFKNARGLSDKLIQDAMTIGKDQGVTDVKIHMATAEKIELAVEGGVLSKSIAGTTYSVSMSIYAGDRVLTFTKNTMDEAILRDAMLQNIQAIHIAPENKGKRLLDAAHVFKGKVPDLDQYDQNPAGLDDLIKYVTDLESAALAVDGAKTTRSVSIVQKNIYSLLRATNGLDQEKSKTTYRAGAMVIAEDQNGMQIDGEGSSACHFVDMIPADQLGTISGKNAVAKLSANLPDTGKMPIVLDHDAAESFFYAVYSAIDGSAVYQGSTFLKDKMGQQVLSKGITLEDDPRIPRSLSSSADDGAGLESKPITFIEDGVLKSFNVSLYEARQLGIDPIGREEGLSNSRVTGGTKTPDELMSDIKQGIYIKGFSGGSVDVNNGTHSRQAHGVLIKDGKITNIPVSGFVVSGNLKEMFMNVVLANDTPSLPSAKHSLAAPTTRINGCTIAGK